MATVWRDYTTRDADVDVADRHWKAMMAAKKATAGLESFQQWLDARLDDVSAEEPCSKAASTTDSGRQIVPTKFSRRLLLPTDQPLDVPAIMRMNRLYHAESKLLEASQDLMIWQMLEGREAGDENPVDMRVFPQLLNACHKQVRRTTDRWTDANEWTAHVSDTPTPAGRFVELDFAELLEDFFRVCQGPNEAELLMLSAVCDESVAWVKQWFVEKRTQVIWLYREEKPSRTKRPK